MTQTLNLPLFSSLFHFQNVIFAPFAPSLHKSESLIRIPATPRTTRGWIPLFLSNLLHQAYSVSASISSDRKAACISAVSSRCGASVLPWHLSLISTLLLTPPRLCQWRGSILPPMSLKQKLIKYPANNAAVVHYLLGRYFISLGLFFLSQCGPVRSISTTPGSVLQRYFLCLFSVNKMLVRATKLHWAEQQI